jgi:hypothetical protein
LGDGKPRELFLGWLSSISYENGDGHENVSIHDIDR